MPDRQTTSLPNVTQFPVANGNWDDERGPIMSVVLHTMVGTVQGANARFNDSTSQVSAHYGIGLDGNIYQWVDEDNVAYHAGNYHVNQTSIGIEHEDGGDYNGVRPDLLYESSAKLVADICKFYDIPCDGEHIFRHQDVIDKTIYPGGTSCPDALDTNRIISMAQNILHPQPVTESQPPVPSTPPVTTEPQDTVTPPATPSVETPQVDQTTSNPPQNSVTNTPDQTPPSPTEPSSPPSDIPPMVPETPNISNWSIQQAIREAVLVLVRLLVSIGLIEEVKE